MFRLILGLLVLTAVGCGKSNPAEDYKDLKTVPKENKNFARLSQEFSPKPLNIEILGQSDQNFANFVEGQQGSVKVRVTPYAGITDYSLEASEKPVGSNIAKTSEQNVWALTWTPPNGTVVAGTSATFPVSLVATVKNATDQRLIGDGSVANPIHITVTKKGVVPSIKVGNFPAKIEEGESYKFQVEVTDTEAGNKKVTPDIFMKACDNGGNKENYILNAGSYIRRESVISNGAGHWVATFTLNPQVGFVDPASIPLKPLEERPKSLEATPNSVKACTIFQVLSPSGVPSDSVPKITEIQFSTQAPEVVFEKAPLIRTPVDVKAGALESIKFSGSIANKRGIAELKVTKSEFDKLPGHPELKCAAGSDPSIQNCEIAWQVPCKAKGDYPITVYGTNSQSSVHGKVKASVTKRTISVAKADATCSDPASAISAADLTPIKVTAKKIKMPKKLAEVKPTPTPADDLAPIKIKKHKKYSSKVVPAAPVAAAKVSNGGSK